MNCLNDRPETDYPNFQINDESYVPNFQRIFENVQCATIVL